MRILAVNGSPRKTRNTARLLTEALKGAQATGATPQIVHLVDYAYKGCISCFACKIDGGKSYGRCSVRDELTPVLENIRDTDALILGSPVYFGTHSGMMRSFLERLLFPYYVYSEPRQSLFGKTIPVGFVYTMNVTEAQFAELNYGQHFGVCERLLRLVFGTCTPLHCYDTLQFNDYAEVVAPLFDAEKKLRRHREAFPKDCRMAFEMGQNLCRGVND